MSWGVKCVMAKAVRAPEQRETVMFVGSGGHGTARSAGSWSGRKQGVAAATYYCALGCRSFGTAGMIVQSVGTAD